MTNRTFLLSFSTFLRSDSYINERLAHNQFAPKAHPTIIPISLGDRLKILRKKERTLRQKKRKGGWQAGEGERRGWGDTERIFLAEA